MPSKSKVTTDHEEIRRWAEERGGKPAHVKATGSGDDPGILRIDFPGYSGEGTLEPISWDEWFRKFDENGLAFLYQERTADGKLSNFNKIVSRETVQASAGRGRSRGSARTEARSSRNARGSRSAASSRTTRGGSSRRRTSAQSGRSSGSSSRTQGRTSRKSASRKNRGSDEVCIPRGEMRRLKSAARSQKRGGSTSRSGSRSRSARAVSSKKSSRGSRGNQGRRAA